MLDARVCHLKDQLVTAKVYLSFSATWNNPHFMRELWLHIKEVLRATGDATKDSEIEKISLFVGYPYFSMFIGSQAFDQMAWRFSLFFFIFSTFFCYCILHLLCSNFSTYEKLKTMEQTLVKGKQIQDDCAAVLGSYVQCFIWQKSNSELTKSRPYFLCI